MRYTAYGNVTLELGGVLYPFRKMYHI